MDYPYELQLKKTWDNLGVPDLGLGETDFSSFEILYIVDFPYYIPLRWIVIHHLGSTILNAQVVLYIGKLVRQLGTVILLQDIWFYGDFDRIFKIEKIYWNSLT